MSDLNVSLILKAVDRATGPVRRVQGALRGLDESQRRISRATANVGKNFGKVTSEAGKLAAKVGVLAGVGGFLFKRELIDTAAQFEQFNAILEQTEGSSEGAKKAMAWVQKFAKTTPFELETVMDSFVKLRAYGMDPTEGLLQSLGDGSAATGKPIIQAVEAIADAVMGENERLKEAFNIKALTKGNKVTYEYVDKEGKQQFKTVQKGNRAAIQAAIQEILSKNQGAMQKQMGTWKGMMSNMSDQWTDFKLRIMQGGLFEYLSGRLRDVLNWVNKMADSGALQRWANKIGQSIKNVVETLWSYREEFKSIVTGTLNGIRWVVDAFGGWKNTAIAVAVVMSAKTIVATGQLIHSVGQLAWTILSRAVPAMAKFAVQLTAMALKGIIAAIPAIGAFAAAMWTAASAVIAATWPILAIIAVIALLAAGAYLIYDNWEPIKAWFGELWEGVKASFKNALDWIMKKIAWVKEQVVAVIDMHKKVANTVGDFFFGSDDEEKAGGGAGYAPRVNTLEGGRRTDVGGSLKITVDSEGRAKVKEMKANGPMGLAVDSGLSPVGL